jgi:thioredoxin-like negative regulator of GroEL
MENMMLRKITIVSALLLFSAFTFSGCDTTVKNKVAPKSTPAIKQAIESKKKTVLFFLDPDDSQCQRQDEIIKKLHKNLAGAFNLIYVSSVNSNDKQVFNDYGISSVPSVVLVDNKGKIAHHLPPGIQPYNKLAMALSATK